MTCNGQFGCYNGDFVNVKPDMREKIREYIGELDIEIDRLEDLLKILIVHMIYRLKVD